MRIKLVVFLCIFQICNLAAQSNAIYAVKSGTIFFQSDAPYEMINASSDNLVGIIDVSKRVFAFRVSIRSFQGFNSQLQREHFNENYLESKKFSDATFDGKIIEEVDLTKDGNYTVRAKGNLVIHGIKQERIIKSEVIKKDGKLFVNASFTVSLSDHEIPIPKVVKDKLANIINVRITCQLDPR